MANDIECPDCGEKGSFRKVTMVYIKTGKRVSFISDIVFGVFAILIGILVLLLLIVTPLFEKVPFEGYNLANNTGIALFAFYCVIFISFGKCSIKRALSIKRAISSDIFRHYKLRCSKCKEEWYQWQKKVREDIQCPRCSSYNVTVWTLLIDPSGKPIVTYTLFTAFAASLFFSFMIILGMFMIILGIWSSTISLPVFGDDVRKSTLGLICIGVGGVLCFSICILEYLLKKETQAYVCFACKLHWPRENQSSSVESVHGENKL